MRRSEVWWIDLPAKQGGRRPVLLLSRNISIEIRSSVTVAEITKTIRRIPVEVELDESDGMPEHCCVNLDNILTIPKKLLESRITTLSPEKMNGVREKILYALDLARR
ncbi:MAG: type II toxin-antitoxin system PemK/MazF family toxin [Actinobacteria bacterium]|nr:type II toxin-antitoxin system PemK/MazF family toxin [Actinomycetota bacterium]